MNAVKKGDAQAEQVYIKPRSEDVEYFGACDVIRAELEAIRHRRGYPEDTVLRSSDLCGIALSGLHPTGVPLSRNRAGVRIAIRRHPPAHCS